MQIAFYTMIESRFRLRLNFLIFRSYLFDLYILTGLNHLIGTQDLDFADDGIASVGGALEYILVRGLNVCMPRFNRSRYGQERARNDSLRSRRP